MGVAEGTGPVHGVCSWLRYLHEPIGDCRDAMVPCVTCIMGGVTIMLRG